MSPREVNPVPAPVNWSHEPVIVAALSRGLDFFRPLAVGYAAWLAWLRVDDMERPWLAVIVLFVLLVWSLALLVIRRRSLTLLVIELSLAVGAIFSTLLIESPETIQAGQFTLPTLWAASPVMGGAILGGARWGLMGALAISLADLVEVGRPTTGTIHNIVLLFLLGGLIGVASDAARYGLERYEKAIAEEEGLRERERLARAVHDGVLQTLAYIHRRGEQLGGEALELSGMAAEQERSLRRLISVGAPDPRSDSAQVDLRLLVSAHEGDRVSVSGPAEPVLLARPRAEEINAAIAAALQNVERHAGTPAHAWVLVEASPTHVRIAVRDNGKGAHLEAVRAAATRGRMGVAGSIVGRINALGGQADIVTSPGCGFRILMDVPREGAMA